MQKIEKRFTQDFTSFHQMEGSSSSHGMNDWAVPWSDLMMVMFVLFVVLFIYASSQQDVKVLFSHQSAEKAQSVSSLDPLIGLIGQIASRAEPGGSKDVVRMAEKEVLYRSRANGITVVRESPGQVRITLRGDLFFDEQSGELKPDSAQYLDEIAEVVRLSLGLVHVIGFADQSESEGAQSFILSSERAANVAEQLITRFNIAPKRLVITGRGAYQPELPDTSEANQALNRRVEIVIANNS
ncbi:MULTISPECIES: OmpA family protein [unclassified Pseudodesulfovibrio]|uniref:OmpA/MotB family protein n=1 Tax=unclassified Pseudodesulfovibrio TaxID=2661612 RepID=UPI000FEBC3B1|nr:MULTISPECIES: OmpA family protein [unclassified Pseudodesulfovibrio]MCJ2163964.1 OmpA family protein [Pseudodesulfovibrio sp. S3-i]RWU05791.1 flagellar motor protein MotB [Pseudodesulfovibrio sp. S3]